jgi:hypothetical protein
MEARAQLERFLEKHDALQTNVSERVMKLSPMTLRIQLIRDSAEARASVRDVSRISVRQRSVFCQVRYYEVFSNPESTNDAECQHVIVLLLLFVLDFSHALVSLAGIERLEENVKQT